MMTHFLHPPYRTYVRVAPIVEKICHHLSAVIWFDSFCRPLSPAQRLDMTRCVFLGSDPNARGAVAILARSRAILRRA
jgi:hypothetical protein